MQVQLSQPTLLRLQKYAEPFSNDVEAAINKALDVADGKNTPALSAPSVKEYRGGQAPNLTWTKVLAATIDGKLLPKAKTAWNQILDEVVLLAAAKLKDSKALERLILVNHAPGKKEDQGYRYLPKAGLSIQGQDSAAAWNATVHILKALNISAELEFMWYDNEKAAYPGESAKLVV